MLCAGIPDTDVGIANTDDRLHSAVSFHASKILRAELPGVLRFPIRNTHSCAYRRVDE